MLVIIEALVPVVLVIATGCAARMTGLVEEHQWLGFQRVTYYLFFPAIIIETLATADLRSVPVVAVGGSLVAAILNVATLLIALRPLLTRAIGLDGPAFTSVFQGATRWNTFVALALAASLYGREGLALMAVAIAAMIPLLNVLAVLVLTRFAGGAPQAPSAIAVTMAKNPFIWSCLIGIALNVLAPPIPKMLLGYADILARAALGGGLLIVGAGLDLARLARPRAAHWLSLALKLVALPLFVVFYARLLDVDGVDLSIALIAATVPTSSAAFILARQLGGDSTLMAEIVTTQTLAAMLTMPLVLALLSP